MMFLEVFGLTNLVVHIILPLKETQSLVLSNF